MTEKTIAPPPTQVTGDGAVSIEGAVSAIPVNLDLTDASQCTCKRLPIRLIVSDMSGPILGSERSTVVV